MANTANSGTINCKFTYSGNIDDKQTNAKIYKESVEYAILTKLRKKAMEEGSELILVDSGSPIAENIDLIIIDSTITDSEITTEGTLQFRIESGGKFFDINNGILLDASGIDYLGIQVKTTVEGTSKKTFEVVLGVRS